MEENFMEYVLRGYCFRGYMLGGKAIRKVRWVKLSSYSVEIQNLKTTSVNTINKLHEEKFSKFKNKHIELQVKVRLKKKKKKFKKIIF